MTVTIDYAIGLTGLTVTATAYAESNGDAAGVALTFMENTTRKGRYSVTATVGGAGNLVAGLNWIQINIGGTSFDSQFLTIPASGSVVLVPSLYEASSVVQTGDSFARLGSNGSGLTALGDARISNLDATVSSRSTLAAGAMMDLVNTPNPSAITSIQNGLATSAALTGVATNAATAVTQTSSASIASAVWSAIITGSTQAGTILSTLWTFLGTYVASPTASAIAAVILKTPANLISTNVDGTVNIGGPPTITVVAPLSSDGGSLSLTTGDSYTAANGQCFKFNITGASHLIGTVPHLRLSGLSSDFAMAPAVVSATQQIVFSDVLGSSTANLTVGTYPYQIRFMNGADVATVIQGYAIVKAGL